MGFRSKENRIETIKNSFICLFSFNHVATTVRINKKKGQPSPSKNQLSNKRSRFLAARHLPRPLILASVITARGILSARRTPQGRQNLPGPFVFPSPASVCVQCNIMRHRASARLSLLDCRREWWCAYQKSEILLDFWLNRILDNVVGNVNFFLAVDSWSRTSLLLSSKRTTCLPFWNPNIQSDCYQRKFDWHFSAWSLRSAGFSVRREQSRVWTQSSPSRTSHCEVALLDISSSNY